MGRPKGAANNDLPPRMLRRTMKSGTAHYYYHARDGKKLPLGTDLSAARVKWAELERSGIVLDERNDLFATISARYRRDVLPTKSPETQAQYLGALDRLDAAFKAFRLPQIRPLHCRQYLDRRSAKVAANREMAVFSGMFNWARELGITDAPNPAKGVRRNRESGREIYVTDEQFQRLWDIAVPELQDALDLARLTGQRPADVRKMRRSDIADGRLWVTQGKTGAKVGIEIVGELATVIQRVLTRPRTATGLYLVQTDKGRPLTQTMYRDRFLAARTASGETWQFRDLRPKAATDIEDLRNAQHLLGHKSETTTANIYRRVRGNKVKPVESGS